VSPSKSRRFGVVTRRGDVHKIIKIPQKIGCHPQKVGPSKCGIKKDNDDGKTLRGLRIVDCGIRNVDLDEYDGDEEMIDKSLYMAYVFMYACV